MKGFALTLAGVLALALMVLPQTAQAQFCFVDNFTFSWDVNLDSGTDIFFGTVDAYTGGIMTGARGQSGRTIRHHVFTAINPALNNDPDCTDGGTQTDWFTYNGLVTPAGGGTYTYAGDWYNSCGSTGTFSGTVTPGACRVQGTPAPVGPSSASPTVSEAEARTTAEGYALASHPNPTERTATISFTIPQSGDVRIAVYDALGREVAVVVDGAHEAGTHRVAFDGADLPAGTYVYRIEAGAYTEASTLMLVR